MNQIEKQVDNIIFNLKREKTFDNIRFIREYGNHSAEMPVSGFIAVVCISETSVSKNYIGGYMDKSVKGEQYTAKVQLKLLSPNSQDGTGLSEITSQLLLGLNTADTNKIISESSASSIDFDAEINAIFRTVDFVIEFCLCEEV